MDGYIEYLCDLVYLGSEQQNQVVNSKLRAQIPI